MCELRPSAPMTTRARSVTLPPLSSCPWMPTTVPSSTTSSSTVNRSRTSAPAAEAASTRIVSSTVRRGAKAVESPSHGCGVPAIVNGPKSNEYVLIGGHPLPATLSSRPQRRSAETPGAWTMCVDTVSLGNDARSTTRMR